MKWIVISSWDWNWQGFKSCNTVILLNISWGFIWPTNVNVRVLLQTYANVRVLAKHVYDKNTLMLIQQYILLSGENNMFVAVFTNKKYRYNQWITLTSASTRETMYLFSNGNYKIRSQTDFVENTCDIGVEKYEKGNITEYVATVRNCADQDKLSTYFNCLLSDLSGGSVQWGSRDLNDPGSPSIRKYFKYVDTYYTRSEKGVYYAVLNHPAMRADNITLERFGFVMYVIEPNDSAIAASHYWYFDI